MSLRLPPVMRALELRFGVTFSLEKNKRQFARKHQQRVNWRPQIAETTREPRNRKR